MLSSYKKMFALLISLWRMLFLVHGLEAPQHLNENDPNVLFFEVRPVVHVLFDFVECVPLGRIVHDESQLGVFFAEERVFVLDDIWVFDS